MTDNSHLKAIARELKTDDPQLCKERRDKVVMFGLVREAGA